MGRLKIQNPVALTHMKSFKLLPLAFHVPVEVILNCYTSESTASLPCWNTECRQAILGDVSLSHELF